jgi:hypothetical protein
MKSALLLAIAGVLGAGALAFEVFLAYHLIRGY